MILNRNFAGENWSGSSEGKKEDGKKTTGQNRPYSALLDQLEIEKKVWYSKNNTNPYVLFLYNSIKKVKEERRKRMSTFSATMPVAALSGPVSLRLGMAHGSIFPVCIHLNHLLTLKYSTSWINMQSANKIKGTVSAVLAYLFWLLAFGNIMPVSVRVWPLVYSIPLCAIIMILWGLSISYLKRHCKKAYDFIFYSGLTLFLNSLLRRFTALSSGIEFALTGLSLVLFLTALYYIMKASEWEKSVRPASLVENGAEAVCNETDRKSVV